MTSTTTTKESAVDGRLFSGVKQSGWEDEDVFEGPSECLNLGKGSIAARSKRLIRKRGCWMSVLVLKEKGCAAISRQGALFGQMPRVVLVGMKKS